MKEAFFEAPTQDELTVSYNGLSFEEFKLLSDQEVDILRLQAREEWIKACETLGGFDDGRWWAARDKTGVFHNFCQWRKYGVPDRDMSNQEFLERMYHYANVRRAADPNYGHIDASYFAHLTTDEQELFAFAQMEMWNDGHSYEGQPTVEAGGNIHHVEERLNVHLDNLVEKGVLDTYVIPPTLLFNESKGYVATGKYAMYLFNERYPAATESE